MTVTKHVTIECPECDGKGGHVIIDSASPGCDETDDVDPCRDCHGEGIMHCELCDETATVEVREQVSVPNPGPLEKKRRVYKNFFCEKCADEVVQNGIV